MVKRSLAVVFLSLYLFSTTEFHELLKLPILFEHFESHKKETPTISFWEFLCIHYAHGQVQDDDHDKDMQLPYKSHDSSCSNNFISILPDQKNTIVKIIPSTIKKNTSKFRVVFITNCFTNSIWQPPKSC
ncbi:hypothetical protein WFZ85_00470 [Flavobacterium sp. j3]|uniref:Uncharacterized protein n=1 Tax=Flavobacterium aureirubrum TaxID=3133147 RepID=A0ABU9N022_9FLAO